MPDMIHSYVHGMKLLMLTGNGQFFSFFFKIGKVVMKAVNVVESFSWGNNRSSKIGVCQYASDIKREKAPTSCSRQQCCSVDDKLETLEHFSGTTSYEQTDSVDMP